MASLLGSITVTVRRQSPLSYVNGEAVRGSESTFTALVSIQPMSGREREDLPEGYRTKRVSKLYTRSDLHVLDVDTATPGDIVEYDGTDWEILSARDFTDHSRPTAHRKYILSEIGADE